MTWLRGTPTTRWQSDPQRLDELIRIVRQLHDSTTLLAPGAECLVHDDLQPRNVVVEGDFVGLIDWEQLRPGRRVEDVSQLCWSFVGPAAHELVADVAMRWRHVLDGYGLVDRFDVVDVAIAKLERAVQDIVRESAGGSDRHRLMRERGDHHQLAATLDWLMRNRIELSLAIS